MALSVWAWLDLAPCAWQAFVWRLRGALSRQAARLSLALRPDKTVAVVDDARRVLDGRPALSSPSSSPVVLALPRIEPHPQALRDVAEYETTRLPVVSRSPSHGLISSSSTTSPAGDRSRALSSSSSSSGVPRRTREATSPGSASPLPSLGGVSAFARLLKRETEPAFPNYHAIILALCEALHSIECDDARMRAIVAQQIVRAALELPRDVDAALFALLPSKPPLPPSGNAPDADEDEDAPMPRWMVEWLMASPTAEPLVPPSSSPSPSSSSSPAPESESESEHDTNTDNRTGAA